MTHEIEKHKAIKRLRNLITLIEADAFSFPQAGCSIRETTPNGHQVYYFTFTGGSKQNLLEMIKTI